MCLPFLPWSHLCEPSEDFFQELYNCPGNFFFLITSYEKLRILLHNHPRGCQTVYFQVQQSIQGVELLSYLSGVFLNCLYWVWAIAAAAASSPLNADAFDLQLLVTMSLQGPHTSWTAGQVQFKFSPFPAASTLQHPTFPAAPSSSTKASLCWYTAVHRPCPFWGSLGIQGNICDIDKTVFPSRSLDDLNLAEISAHWCVSVRIPTLSRWTVINVWI